MCGVGLYVAVFLFLSFLPTGALSSRQIYFSEDVNDYDLDCDLEHEQYPIVSLPEDCSLKTTDFCDITGPKEEPCNLHGLCPNGTLPQCAHNEDGPALTKKIICVPIDLKCEPCKSLFYKRLR